jgi:signal transduction histidine kinase
MIEIADLRKVPLFAALSDEQLECLPFVEQGEEVRVSDGERLVNEGDPPAFYVLLDGELQVLKKVGDQETLLLTHRPGAFFGEVPLLLGTSIVASAQAVGEARLYRLAEGPFWQMLSSCPTIARGILQTMAGRVQGLEAVAQGRERLVALGTMSAGIAHELNNPAAASRRAASQLREALLEMQSRSCQLHKQPLSPEQTEFLAALQREAMDRCSSSRLPLDPLEQSDREEEWEQWLTAHGIGDGWKLAPALVAARLDSGWREDLAARLPAAALGITIGWIEATLTVSALLDQVEQGTARISDLVKAVKAYSFRDQTSRQEIDVHEGLESTLTMLGHKLKGITVTREYDRSLPRIDAYGGELNQVWTNLIDNAADAVNGQGRIEIRTARENNHVRVEIVDNGPGIPAEVQAHLFEPFFTTKEIGKGTGLGLATSYRIVMMQHKGDIHVTSKPGETRFAVRLPIDGAPDRPGPSPVPAETAVPLIREKRP